MVIQLIFNRASDRSYFLIEILKNFGLSGWNTKTGIDISQNLESDCGALLTLKKQNGNGFPKWQLWRHRIVNSKILTTGSPLKLTAFGHAYTYLPKGCLGGFFFQNKFFFNYKSLGIRWLEQVYAIRLIILLKKITQN